MTTSNDYSFNPNVYKIVTGAMRLVSAIETGEAPPDDEFQDAFDALNGMVVAWQASGIHVWAEVDATLFLQPGQIDYNVGATSTDHITLSNAWVQTALASTAPPAVNSVGVQSAVGINTLDHIGIWLDAGTTFWTTVTSVSGNAIGLASPLPSQATAGAQVVDYAQPMQRPLRAPAGRRLQFAVPGGQPIETPMVPMSRLDYAATPNKKTPGTVTQFFYDPQLVLGVMHVWPAPTTNMNAMKFTAQRPLQDFVTQANTADFPQEWVSCLRFNLAKEIGLEYDVPAERWQVLLGLAKEKFDMCSTWDREPESIQFGVAYDPTSRN